MIYRRIENIHVVVRYDARIERHELFVDFPHRRFNRKVVRERYDKYFAFRIFDVRYGFYFARDFVYEADKRSGNAVFFVRRLAFFATAWVYGIVLRDGKKLRERIFAHARYDFGGDFVRKTRLRKTELSVFFIEPFGV